MFFPSGTDVRLLAAATALSALLSGCSDIYYERRETISPQAGNAMAANRVTHMVDPWPASSANLSSKVRVSRSSPSSGSSQAATSSS